MTVIDSTLAFSCPWSAGLRLIDTHTHFDAPDFDKDRLRQAQAAYNKGVHHLVLVGYLYQYFDRLYDVQQAFRKADAKAVSGQITTSSVLPQAHIALGLHPFYIEQHTDAHLSNLAQMLNERRPIAIGEIGLDTYTETMKQPDMFAKQRRFFSAQLDMAVTHQLPVMLHIRKAHAEALALLKMHAYNAHEFGGIAHSFSGGEQEAKAFVKLGFKLGVTGQVTNPNAKKLRRAIRAAVDRYGIECLVVETDCPDMTPIMKVTTQPAHEQSPSNEQRNVTYNRNVPANLPWVLMGLSELLEVSAVTLAPQLWKNSCDALKTVWTYPA